MDSFKELLKELLTSKKMVAAIVGILVITAQKFGVIVDEGTLYQLLAVIGTYILGQGIADAGKEAAQVKVDNIPSEEAKLEEDKPQEDKDTREILRLLRDNPRLAPYVLTALKLKAKELDDASRKILGESSEVGD